MFTLQQELLLKYASILQGLSKLKRSSAYCDSLWTVRQELCKMLKYIIYWFILYNNFVMYILPILWVKILSFTEVQ